MRFAFAILTISLIFLTSGCLRETEEIINITEPEEEENITAEEEPEEIDLCASMACDDAITTCPDGLIVTCGNTCDPETGSCSSCKPDCSGHECNITCDGPCEFLYEEECICSTELNCPGNGICEPNYINSTEWPDGDDCLPFDSCSDNNSCTLDVFDPNLQACLHYDSCCDDNDTCTEDSWNSSTNQCEHTYICCNNSICDPGDATYCPEDCEAQDNESGQPGINITEIDPLDNETVTLEGYGTDMTNWTIEDAKNNTYSFPDGFVIDGIAYLHTVGCPSDNNDTDLFWGTKTGECRVGKIWNNEGDNATLRNHLGEVISFYEY